MKHYYNLTTLCYIFFIAFSFFLFKALEYPEGHREIDSPEYETIARHFATTQELVNPHYPQQMPSHTLGYHWFLGTIYKFFGIDNLIALFCIQLLLALLCCWMLLHIANILFNQSIALLTLGGMVLNLGFLIYPQLIMAEMLMTTLLIGFLCCYIKFLHQRKLHYLIASLLSLSLSVLVKPVALYFMVPFFFGIVLFRPWQSKNILYTCLVCIVTFYIPLAAYMSYNYYTFNKAAITTLVEENLYIYFLPRRILPRLSAEERISFENTLSAAPSAEEKMNCSREIFHTLVRTKPQLFVFAWIESMIKIICGLHATQLKGMFNSTIKGGSCSFFARTHNNILARAHEYIIFGATKWWIGIIAYADALMLLARYLFFILGIMALFFSRAYYLLYFFISYCSYFIVVAAHDGCARYRMMIEPVLILVAAVGIYSLYILLRHRKQSWSTLFTAPIAT